MELEKNMYVRTKDGVIGKITNEDYTYYKSWIIDTLYYNFDEDIDKWTCGVKEYEISEASHNIIDLIEVGDYVNGVRIDELSHNRFTNAKAVTTNNSLRKDTGKQYWFENEDIKSIVTKEQFEAMKYEIK